MPVYVPRQTIKSTSRTQKRVRLKKQPDEACEYSVREAEAAAMPLRGLRVMPGREAVDFAGNHGILLECAFCGEQKYRLISTLRKRPTAGCACKGVGQWAGDQRTRILGERYDSMVQRCTRDSHRSSHLYKGRGIRVLFESRAAFVKWALDSYPDAAFTRMDFDRIDNDGHYSPDNLRLVTRKQNIRNKKEPMLTVSWEGKPMLLADWYLQYSPYSQRVTYQYCVEEGMTGEQIIAQAVETIRNPSGKWKTVYDRLMQKYPQALSGVVPMKTVSWRGQQVFVDDWCKRFPAYTTGYVVTLVKAGLTGEQILARRGMAAPIRLRTRLKPQCPVD